jgi:phosphatidylglycerophosphate synthase
MITGNETQDNHILLWSSIILNILANLDKTNVTFVLGVIVSILAIINYVIQIKKNLKKRK